MGYEKALKVAVAEAVFNTVSKCAIERNIDEIKEPRIVSVEVHEISALVRQIRVKTQDMGTHYYTVKVSEAW